MRSIYRTMGEWAVAGLVLALFALSLRAAQYPGWWFEWGVVDADVTNDYAAVNQGQLKNIAWQAYEEMQTNLPGGAGTGVFSRVSGFSLSNNYAPLNLGQVKHVAEPFYYRLMEVGYATNYPWQGAASTNDFAMANIGQVKNLFCFDVTTDTDEDGLPDWWETHWFGSVTNQVSDGDFDADGLSNLLEYQLQANPGDQDSDDDGLDDGDEVNTYGSNPLNSDSDNDGVSDGVEVAQRTDPTNPEIAVPVITLVSPMQGEARVWIP